MRENGGDLAVQKRGEKEEERKRLRGLKEDGDLTDDPATKSSLLNAPLNALVYYNERAARRPHRHEFLARVVVGTEFLRSRGYARAGATCVRRGKCCRRLLHLFHGDRPTVCSVDLSPGAQR